MMSVKRAHIYIEGRVQGVFYRAFTRNVAIKRGLCGWVRNLHDGRVEAVFEGNEASIEHALTELRKGPPGSAVYAIDIEWKEPPESLQDFEIRY